MIVIQIYGGLGNQFFQYAFGRRLAQAKGVPLGLDIAHYQQDRRRAYGLGHFNIQARPVTPQEALRAQGRAGQSLLARAWRQRHRLLSYYRRRLVIEQRPFVYDPRLLQVRSDAYLRGYWQNEKYFAPIGDRLRAELTLKAPLSPASAAMAAEIDRTEAVGVHVRRGDYAEVPITRERHGLVSLEYYQRCARQVLDEHPRSVFYMFSDDPAWVAGNLDLGGPCVLVDHNGPERDFEDLYLLSRCRHFIIANSTFSWWAAWLSIWPTKRVFAPSRWQASGPDDPSDIVPAGWQRV